MLQTKGLDVAFCTTKVNEFQRNQQNERDMGFPFLWERSNDVTQKKKNE
jgi:hypothetical protein